MYIIYGFHASLIYQHSVDYLINNCKWNQTNDEAKPNYAAHISNASSCCVRERGGWSMRSNTICVIVSIHNFSLHIFSLRIKWLILILCKITITVNASQLPNLEQIRLLLGGFKIDSADYFGRRNHFWSINVGRIDPN